MFTDEQKKRLRALHAKASRTADEEKEYQKLLTEAKAANFDHTKAETAEGMTEDDVKKAIQDGTIKALEAIGLDKTTLDAIKANIAEAQKGGEPLTAEGVEAAVKKVLGGGGIDQKALIEEIKKALPATEAAKGISEEQLTKALKDFGDTFRTASRAEFPEGKAVQEYPIEHRSGNLSIAERQLANICLMEVSKSAIAQSGIKRPESMDDGIPAELLKNAQIRGESAIKSLRIAAGRKALTRGGAGTGAELIPTDLSSTLQMRLYLESQIAAEFVASEIDMPTDPFKLPMVTTRPTFYVGSEAPGSDPTASTPGTAQPTLTTAKLIGITEYSYEADEDSIIAVLPMLQDGLAQGAAASIEDAIINGDADGTHQDSDTQAVANHAAKLFNGLRKAALSVGALSVSLSTGGISAANVLAIKKAMGKYGVRPRDLMLIAGVKGYNDFIGLEETLTAEKVGSNAARILTGEAPSLYGIRIIISEAIRENLQAGGYYDGATTTKGSFLLVHRPSWLMGVRRGFTVEVDVDKKRQINSVIASFRRAFTPKETNAVATPIVAIGRDYNS